MTDVWLLVHAERAALIDDLVGLTDAQWAQPSLCEGWTVHDVAAHLVANAQATRRDLLKAMARARFDLDRQTGHGVVRRRGATPAETLDRLRQVSLRRTTPGAPLDSRLVEEVVHGEDIRRPLGITRSYPRETVLRALAYQARTWVALGGAKQRVAGLRLVATDEGVSLGEGAEVRGPAVSLLLAVSGRTVALDDLAGPGVTTLAGRLAGR